MFREKLLAHQIEQVEKAGYYVIPKDRVERLQAQYSYDTLTEEAYTDAAAKGLRQWQERELLLSMAYELGKVVRWTENLDSERAQRVVRAILTVITPKKDYENEIPRRLPYFSDAPGCHAGPLRFPQAQGRAKGGTPGAG